MTVDRARTPLKVQAEFREFYNANSATLILRSCANAACSLWIS
jgi:hypothetical protein